MASIHKDPRGKSPFYYAAFYGADGSRKFRSTKATDRKTALNIALAWERAAEQGRRGNLTAVQARKVLAEIVQISTGESLSEFSVQGWIDQWLDAKAGSATTATMARYRQVLRDFLTSLDRRAAAPLTGVTPGDITAFRDSLRREGRALSTCKVTMKVISVPFEAARKLGYILSNPVAAVDALKDKRESQQGGREPFTLAELQLLLSAADEAWRGLILLAFTTGLRLGDCAHLTWGNIDLKSGTITLKTQKTGATVTLPVHQDFGAWLSGRAPGVGLAPIFPELDGKPIGGRNGLSLTFGSIMKSAGIVQRVVTREGKGRTTYSKGFHSLRHTFVSLLANAGVNPDVRQKLAGHSDPAVHAGYSHHELETLREAVAKIPHIG